MIIYNSQRVIVRRAVTRFDGFTDTGIPASNITVYDSNQTEVQNAVAIDDATGAALTGGFVAAFYNVCNNTGTVGCASRYLRGSMAINPSNYTMGTEGLGAVQGLTVEDLASYGGQFGISQLNAVNAVYTRATIIGAAQSGVYNAGGGSWQDFIVANSGGRAYNGTTPLTSVAWNNGDNAGGTVLNPFTNGLLYLPRIETGSVLSSGGTGGQRGAQIVNKIGVSGTLYGDAGYNTTTTESLWPFPNEARIKKEMCTDAGVTRGFCSDTSLTHYIMNYLGNGDPYGGITPTASRYYAVTPCRVVDTRGPSGPLGGPALAAGSQRAFALTATCNVPALAKSVSANITVVSPTTAGEFRLYPADQAVPNTSTLSFRAGQTRANNALLLLAGDGSGRVSVQANIPSGTAHIVIDVNGYFQ